MTGWTARLTIDHGELDRQHQELFVRVDALLVACAGDGGRVEVVRTVGFLGDYVLRHFAFEEREMARRGYPRLVEHRGLHATFAYNLRRIRREIDASGPSSAMAGNVRRLVVGWLVNHIDRSDRDFAQFVAQSGGPPSPAPSRRVA
ncbi:MAG: hemerythrin family protein [Polyangiaceae bacterium]|nr:hemerythrin family protein [Polyangiaceae bacterium]